LILNILISTIIVAPVLWLSGRSLVGKEKAKFSDAVWIVIIGTVAGTLIGFFSTGLIGSVIQLILWLLIVKHFFDCGWLRAFAISLIAVIFFALVTFALAAIGILIFQFI
jgi:hypothetical protein